MLEHKGNSGKGFVIRDSHSHRNPKLTLERCSAWFVAGNKGNIYLAGRDTHEGLKENKPHLLQRELINFGWAAQWPGVLDYFAEMLEKKAFKGKKPLLKVKPTAIAPLPGSDAFAYPLARWLRCGLLQGVSRSLDKDGLSISFSFRTPVGEEERVLILCETFSVSDLPELDALIRSVKKRGGKVIGIGCAVNDTFPLREAYLGVPIISVIASEIERFPLGEHGSSGMDAEIVENPYDPDVWESLIGEKTRQAKKKEKNG